MISITKKIKYSTFISYFEYDDIDMIDNHHSDYYYRDSYYDEVSVIATIHMKPIKHQMTDYFNVSLESEYVENIHHILSEMKSFEREEKINSIL